MKWKIRKHFFVFLVVFLLVLGLGAFVYHKAENWSYLDSAYFVVVTVTTVGYGDLTPQTNVGKVFTMFFSFFGIAMAFYLVSLITHLITEKHVNKIKSHIKKRKN